jgi:MFS transporter, DHA1 family, multidrug resistance protein
MRRRLPPKPSFLSRLFYKDMSVSNFIPLGTQVLLATHSIFWLAANMVSPFLGIFFVSELTGVTLTEVGVSSLIFYLSFGLLEPVIGVISDAIKGLKDEAVLLIFGYIARGILFIWFAYATNAWDLYMFQFLLGAFRAIASPADRVLYAKSLEKHSSATLWGIDDSFVNLSAALGAGIGGYLIGLFGFRMILVVAGCLTIFSGLLNFGLLQIYAAKRK